MSQNCSCNQSPCCCGSSPCQPANVVYQGACTDPGSNNTGAHLSILDNSFCPRRLLNAAGFLENRQTGSGWAQQWTTAPTVALGTFQAVTGAAFGNFVIIGSDSVWRQLLGPATANLVLTTNALGQVYFAVPPPATIPDPLTVTTLNTTNLNVSGPATFNGTDVFNNLPTAAITQTIGLNASNQLVIGTAATTGTQTAMFFESPTSPAAAVPNANTPAGTNLIIGNLIYDSVLPVVPGGALWTVTSSQTLTCVTPGTYLVNFEGQVTYDSGSSGNPSILLLVNGTVVSNGNSRPSGVTTTLRAANLCGTYSRRFAAGDTINLQLGSGSGTNTNVYEARVNLTRTGP